MSLRGLVGVPWRIIAIPWLPDSSPTRSLDGFRQPFCQVIKTWTLKETFQGSGTVRLGIRDFNPGPVMSVCGLDHDLLTTLQGWRQLSKNKLPRSTYELLENEGGKKTTHQSRAYN